MSKRKLNQAALSLSTAGNSNPGHHQNHPTSNHKFEGAQIDCSAIDEICAVAPSPELQARLKERFRQLSAQLTQLESAGAKVAVRRSRGGAGAQSKDDDLDAMIANLMQIKHPTHIGFNDGLIIPGDNFPLGTPPRVIRRAALARAPLSGTLRVVVVLINFKDKKMSSDHGKAHFEELFFSTGALPNGSVKEYYREVTNGIINIEGQVVGPFTLSQKRSFYAHGESGIGNALPNARTMAQEAAALANASVDFAPFDNDGNGFVDAFIVIHAGSGGEMTGSVNDIWSHKWLLPAEFSADGTKIFAYLTVPEDSKIGVCCHELGHLLFGFPDLYDTDGSSEGVGNWCLMGGGSWNGGGDIPAHFSAWCKLNQGWVTVVTQNTNANVTIKDVKTSRTVYRLWKDGASSNEYFLVENRQRTFYDKKLPGDGLLVWHIDESIDSNSSEIHPKVKLMEADGKRQMEKGVNRGDGGDPYPGSSKRTSFDETATPGSKSYAGLSTCVAITNIGSSAATMTARFNVKCTTANSAATKKSKGQKSKGSKNQVKTQTKPKQAAKKSSRKTGK